MDIEKIVAKCKQLHLFKTNKDVLFKSLNELDKDTLLALSDKLKPGDEFKPVILLRFLICQLLLSKVEVTEEVINNIKSSIENRDISEYYLASGVFIQKLKDYKISKKGMFPQWKEPFLVLFPFFYNESEREAVNLQLKEIANSIIDTHHLKNARAHTVDFYGSNHYGDDRVWLAIIPDAALSVQNAFQLFFTINSAGFEGGLNSGHKVAPKKQVREVKNYNTFEEYSAELEKIIPRWEGLNKEINFSHQKEEKDFKNRIKRTDENCLQLYFNLLDQLIAELDIPDEESLVFSTSSNQLSFQIGKRYCLNLKKDIFSFITPSDYEIAGISKGYFSEPDVAAYQKDVKPAEIVKHYDAIEQAVRYELDRDNHTKPKEYDNAVFRRAAFDKEYRQAFFNFIEGEIDLPSTTIEALNPMENSMHLNQILYGPPGTGKTYHTINEALTLCGYPIPENREAALEQFYSLIQKKQIVFTTFHQSMSYEDFIEGIKPQEPTEEGGHISYAIEAGLFKQIAVEAAFSLAEVNKIKETEKILNFSDAFDKFKEDVEDKLEEGKEMQLKTKSGGYVLVDTVSQNGNLQIKHKGKDKLYTASKRRLSRLHFEIDNLENVSNFGTAFKEIIGGSNSTTNWAVLNHIRNHYLNGETVTNQEKKYNWEDKYEVVKKLTNENYKNKSGKAHVLIIDEINRGNVSAIFGELITLIEEDKRLGKDEALTATLPYSKDTFGVPPNLYIIGTMNTADRSVEALDTALRRRFSFKEIMPNPGLLQKIAFEGFNLEEVLKTINERIEFLLDRDHTIGHSYFMNLESHDTISLKEIFKNKVIPLLQEYFYHDYEKIALILGPGFVKVTTNHKVKFPSFDGISPPDNVTLCELVDVDDIEEAIHKLFNNDGE